MADEIELRDFDVQGDDGDYQDTSFSGENQAAGGADPQDDEFYYGPDPPTEEPEAQVLSNWKRANPNYNRDLQFRSDEYGALFAKLADGLWIRLSYKNNPNKFYAASTLSSKHSTLLIRSLGMIDRRQVAEVSTNVDHVITVLDDDETQPKQLDESVSNVIETLKGIPMRDLLGLDQALKTIRGSLMVQEGKRVELQTSIDRWEDVLKNNPSDKENLERDIRKAKEQLVPIHESIDILKGKLKSQLTAIKETLYRLLDKNLSLREKIATLFREQGITIFSVLTAIGMTIGFLVELLLPGGAPPPLPPPPPSSQGGIQEWLKRQLDAIGKLLARLASKFGAALPGILGSIVSWLLSTLGKTVVWLGEHLWVIGMLVVGFLWSKLQTS